MTVPPVLRTVAVAIAAVVCVTTVRVVVSARGELREAEKQLAKQNREDAIFYFRRAARWYAPGLPYTTRAIDRLMEIGTDAEREGDRPTALMAFRGVRSAILSTRSFYIPHASKLHAANRHIAALMAYDVPPIDAQKTYDALRREHLALLEAPQGPRPFWGFLGVLGFGVFVTGGFLFASRAIDAEDRLVRPEAMRWGSVIVLGFVVFVWSMRMA